MSWKIQKAVIPVAGLGTRGLPFTKEVPKELLPVLDTPAIQFVVEEVLASGIEQVVFVTGKGKASLEDYFDPSPGLLTLLEKRGKHELAEKISRIGHMCEVISVRQKEPLGLGHAVLCARSVIQKTPFAVCLGDEIFPMWKPKQEPVLKGLVEHAGHSKLSVVGVMEVALSETQNYGIVDTGDTPVTSDRPALVKNTIEKPKPEKAPSRLAMVGRYVFDPEIFDCLKEVRPGVGGEIQLTDAMDLLAKGKKLMAAMITAPRYDVGNLFSYLKVQLDAAMHRSDLARPLKEYLSSL